MGFFQRTSPRRRGRIGSPDGAREADAGKVALQPKLGSRIGGMDAAAAAEKNPAWHREDPFEARIQRSTQAGADAGADAAANTPAKPAGNWVEWSGGHKWMSNSPATAPEPEPDPAPAEENPLDTPSWESRPPPMLTQQPPAYQKPPQTWLKLPEVPGMGKPVDVPSGTNAWESRPPMLAQQTPPNQKPPQMWPELPKVPGMGEPVDVPSGTNAWERPPPMLAQQTPPNQKPPQMWPELPKVPGMGEPVDVPSGTPSWESRPPLMAQQPPQYQKPPPKWPELPKVPGMGDKVQDATGDSPTLTTPQPTYQGLPQTTPTALPLMTPDTSPFTGLPWVPGAPPLLPPPLPEVPEYLLQKGRMEKEKLATWEDHYKGMAAGTPAQAHVPLRPPEAAAGSQPGDGVLRKAERPVGAVPGKPPWQTPEPDPQPSSAAPGNALLDDLAAYNVAASGKDATTLAVEAMGITDAQRWQVVPAEHESYNLMRDGQLVGSVVPRQNRINLLQPSIYEEAQEQARMARARRDGLPIYYIGGKQPMQPEELRDYIRGGMDALTHARTDAEAEQRLAAAGLAPREITQNVRSGRLSVQDGTRLLSEFYGIQQVESTPAATRTAFQTYLAASPVESSLFQDPASKAEVVNRFFDQFSQQSSGNIIMNRAGLGEQREAMLREVTPKESAMEKAGGFAKNTAMPIVGMGAQFASLVARAGAPALLPAGPLKSLLGENEADRISNEGFANFKDHLPEAWHRMKDAAQVALDTPFQELRVWASQAAPGEAVPQALADSIAQAAYEVYHRLGDSTAKGRHSTRDTFDVNKDPTLRAMVQRYLLTADPSAMEGIVPVLMMDARDREHQQQVMAYIEAPRTATGADAAARAKLAGLSIDAAQGSQLIALGAQLDKATTQEEMQALVRQAGGILGTTTPEDAALAVSLITRQTSTDPNSMWGLVKGGYIAGRQELLTEVLTTGAELGLSALTGGAATPEVIALRAARMGAAATTRNALRRVGTAAMNGMAQETRLLSSLGARLSAARSTLARLKTHAADEFASFGIKAPTFGQPLTRLDQARNLAVGVAKTAGAAAPMEAAEESFAALGEPGVTTTSVVEQAGMGALGGLFLAPMFTSGGALASAWQARGGAARLAESKTRWAEQFNRHMAGTPGFKPLRPEDFDTALAAMHTPAHAAAREEYLAALAGMDETQQQAAEVERIHHRLAELEQQHGPRQETTGPAAAGGPPSSRPRRILTTEEAELLARREEMLADPRLADAPARHQAAQARVDQASAALAEASTSAFAGVAEIRHLPAAEQPLHTALAKALGGAREFTTAESQALMALQGDQAVRFTKARPQGRSPSPSQAAPHTTRAPSVIQTAPGRYRLPDDVQIHIPPQAAALLAARAPSLKGLLDAARQQQGVASARVDRATTGAQNSSHGLGIDSPADLSLYHELPDSALDREERAALDGLRTRYGPGVFAASPWQPLLAAGQTPREKENRRSALFNFGHLGQELQKVFGKRVLFVGRRGKALPDNGYNLGVSRNVLAVDVDGAEPVLYLTGHELGHAMQAQAPELYAELQTALLAMAGDTAAFRERLGKMGYEKAEMDAEIVNDFIGSQFLEPAFWRDLMARDKSLFGRIADFALKFLQFIAGKAATLSRDVRPLFEKDITRARATLVEILKAYADRADFPQQGTLAGELARSTSPATKQAVRIVANLTPKEKAGKLNPHERRVIAAARATLRQAAEAGASGSQAQTLIPATATSATPSSGKQPSTTVNNSSSVAEPRRTDGQPPPLANHRQPLPTTANHRKLPPSAAPPARRSVSRAHAGSSPTSWPDRHMPASTPPCRQTWHRPRPWWRRPKCSSPSLWRQAVCPVTADRALRLPWPPFHLQAISQPHLPG